ncbi:hypothetical protein ACFXJ5_17050 [Streptomyces sp. NPDC059373]
MTHRLPALHVAVDLEPDELAAIVDHVRTTGQCPRCGGPARVTDGPGSAVRLDTEHVPGCAVGGDDLPDTFKGAARR